MSVQNNNESNQQPSLFPVILNLLSQIENVAHVEESSINRAKQLLLEHEQATSLIFMLINPDHEFYSVLPIKILCHDISGVNILRVFSNIITRNPIAPRLLSTAIRQIFSSAEKAENATLPPMLINLLDKTDQEIYDVWTKDHVTKEYSFLRLCMIWYYEDNTNNILELDNHFTTTSLFRPSWLIEKNDASSQMYKDVIETAEKSTDEWNKMSTLKKIYELSLHTQNMTLKKETASSILDMLRPLQKAYEDKTAPKNSFISLINEIVGDDFREALESDEPLTDTLKAPETEEEKANMQAKMMQCVGNIMGTMHKLPEAMRGSEVKDMLSIFASDENVASVMDNWENITGLDFSQLLSKK